MIPPILVRTVPKQTTAQVETWWERWCELHPTWRHVTYREPIDPTLFPLTSPHWKRCKNGAQKAGLIRLEALHEHGGIYLDSDVEPYRELDCLRMFRTFGCFENVDSANDAVLGSEPNVPVLLEAIDLAIERLPEGALRSGPGVVNTVFRDRCDVVMLPPEHFSPYLWNEKHRRDEPHWANPACFGAHHWHNSHGA